MMLHPDDLPKDRHVLRWESDKKKFFTKCQCGWESDRFPTKREAMRQGIDVHFAMNSIVTKREGFEDDGTKPVSIEGKWSEVAGHKVHKIDGSGKL